MDLPLGYNECEAFWLEDEQMSDEDALVYKPAYLVSLY